MARKPTPDLMSEILTGKDDQTPSDNSDLDKGNVRPVSCGLTQGTIEALDNMAAAFQTSRGGLMKLAIRLFLLDYRSGKIDIDQYFSEPPPPKKKLDLPS